MQVAYFTTNEWSAVDVEHNLDLALETIVAARELVVDLDVTITHVDTGYETVENDWKLTGPDVIEAAARLDVDVEDE